MEREEDGRSSQLDLFAWRGRDGGTVDGGPGEGGARPSGPERRAAPDPPNIAAMTTPALLGALEAGLLPGTAAGRVLPRLIAEVERRREAAAAPLLVKICRRHAGFDRARVVPEVAAALRALAAAGAAGAPEAAPAILRLVTQDAFGPASVAAALRYLAVARHRPAGAWLPHGFAHQAPEVRAAACGLAAALGTTRAIKSLLELRADNNRVADAALLALGRLGYRPAKADLEAWLETAPPARMPEIVEALAAVADGDAAIAIGRAGLRSADPALRGLIARTLAELDGKAASTWLRRLTGEPEPDAAGTADSTSDS